MWCPTCRADIAAELSSDNRRMLCVRCHSELGIAASVIPQSTKTPDAVEMERDARELLARWSSQNLLDMPVSPPKISDGGNLFAANRDSRQILPNPATMPTPTVARSDGSAEVIHPAQAARAKDRAEQSATVEDNSRRHESTSNHSESSQPRSVNIPAQTHPHSVVQQHDSHNQAVLLHEYVNAPVPRRTTIATVIGQFLAYFGVGLLTCGSVLVTWSLFGGPASYMPTGWLTAAVGQMLLLLGVVTLISSGMDHTIAEVKWRIDHLAEEVHHMGLSLDDLEDEQRSARLEMPNSASRETHDHSVRKAA